MPPAMFRPSAKPLSGRYLSFAEREEDRTSSRARLLHAEVGRRLWTNSFNDFAGVAAQRCDPKRQPEYRVTTAQWHASDLLAAQSSEACA